MRTKTFLLTVAFLLFVVQAHASERMVSGIPVVVFEVSLNQYEIWPEFSAGFPFGDEDALTLATRLRPEYSITGTYFSEASLKPIGDIVRDGVLVYRGGEGFPWFGIDKSNKPVISANTYDPVKYKMLIAGGPILVRNGSVDIFPLYKFTEKHITNGVPAVRSGIGIKGNKTVLFVATKKTITLRKFAEIFVALGVDSAINMDGGGSTFMYEHGDVHIKPVRRLTNILCAYKTSSISRMNIDLEPINTASAPQEEKQPVKNESESNESEEKTGVQDAVGEPQTATYSQKTYRGVQVEIIQIDGSRGVSIRVSTAKGFPGQGKRPLDIVENDRPVVAISGGLFDTSSMRPIGHFIGNGQSIRGGSFPMIVVKNGVLSIDTSGSFPTGDVSFAMGAGPTLVKNGQIALNPEAEGFRASHLTQNIPAFRTGIGVGFNNEMYLVTTDGEVTINEFALIFKELGIKDAIALSGGPHQFLYFDGTTIKNSELQTPFILEIFCAVCDKLIARR